MQEQRKALFTDIDGTLIRWIYFDYWIRACVEQGLFSRHILIDLDRDLMEYKTRKIYFEQYVKTMLASIKKPGTLNGTPESAMEEVCLELARKMHGNTHVITAELIVAAHQCGYFIAFISGSPTPAIQGLSRYFNGVNACLGSDLVLENGIYTGEVDDRVVHNKDEAVLHLASEFGLDLSHSIAIGDSPSDEKMFKQVGYPIVLNPNIELDEHARESHWPIVLEKKMIHVEVFSKGGSPYVSSNLFDILPYEIAETLHSRLKEMRFL